MDKTVDREDMYSVLEDFPNQVRDAWKLAEDIKISDIDRIIITGMGGSALSGEILKSYLFNNFKIPVEINKNYDLPEYANSKTLLWVSSYSGNTEETIEAFRKGNRKGCKIFVITSGGRLAELARKLNKTLIKMPSGIQPRLAYGYSFFPILKILQNSSLVENKDIEIKKLVEVLGKDIYKKKAEELSKKLEGKIPVIYSSERLYAVAYKWKINFNENSKVSAFCNYFPELNHNEMMGYTKLNGNYYVLIIKDDYDDRRIKKRMEATKKIMQSCGVPVLDIELTGMSDLIKIFSTIYLGDWTSYFLALINKVDPTPVELVETLKKKL